MTLVRLDDISLEFGDQPILRSASLALEAHERVCLIGRNGAGKTTLFRLLSGTQQPDSGEITLAAGVTIAQLEQIIPEARPVSVRDYVTDGLADLRRMREEYERLSACAPDAAQMQELERLHRQLDAGGGWHVEQRVDSFISEMELPGDKPLKSLSGGWRRRVALARALVSEPDLLLLDEPTNHLDIVSIRWLEERVRNYAGGVLFVTHDRAFLRTLATRIVELDRGKLVSWPGTYDDYLRRKAKALEDEERDNALFDKRLAEEETWIRQGVKARRTRNEGRVRALEAMRVERAARIKRGASARIRIDQAENSGRKVIRLHNVSYGYDPEQPIVRDLSLRVMRGDRIGLVGNNGVGKSTLLRLMLGQLTPDAGSVKHGTNLSIGYFDQLRQDLEPSKSVAYNVADGRDYVTINGKQQHIVGYLRGFLFSAKRALSPVSALSGGERNRVILARLFTQASNLLVLDEPTNDLDIETLEVLEQQLVDYNGTLIVTSHDRDFLDAVVTSILVFEDDGKVHEYVGGYSDWLRRGQQLAEVESPTRGGPGKLREAAPQNDGTAAAPRRSASRKLSYKDQRELDALPERIEQLEADVAALNEQIAGDGFYAQPYEATQPVLDDLATCESELNAATERWLELEELRERLAGGQANADTP